MNNSGFSKVETILSGGLLAFILWGNLEVSKNNQELANKTLNQSKGSSFNSSLADELGLLAIKIMTPNPNHKDICSRQSASANLTAARADQNDFIRLSVPTSGSANN